MESNDNLNVLIIPLSVNDILYGISISLRHISFIN